MSQPTAIAITGRGAVSPAGWGTDALLRALAAGETIRPTSIERQSPHGMVSTPVRRVPDGAAHVPRHPRLRRVSPIARFAAAAAVEALGEARLAECRAGRLRVGVVFTLSNGCVNYSNRFFAEVLADPALASPILFPETVFNAPSSHISATIGSQAANDTLVGDASAFFDGVQLAADWIARGEVDGCLVVAAEEIDWLSAEALRLYSQGLCAAEGAGAVYLEPAAGPVTIARLPLPVAYHAINRIRAAARIREHLAATDDGRTLLVDSCCGVARCDAPEILAWADWRGPRWSPKSLLGDAIGASAALQLVAAAAAIHSGRYQRAALPVTGANQQAAGLTLAAGAA